ncbi:retrovirus-related pol polyprotein from transposon TNT 1-94 [Tanacetum coccineum]|uniref:Retrovirus-related pol polyprotein from transposon TNT 1-94 n=1 Tax=Tanacetum coccineum TaxID=301880 RepID=A0ABQ4WRR6_9ASTR
MWNDLKLSHEGPSDTSDIKVTALRLKFNAFKALEVVKDSDSDVEEDTRSSSEFLVDLNDEVKAFMTIVEDEPVVGKTDTRFGQWVEITIKNVIRVLSITGDDERKHVLDYTNVDLYFVEYQRKNLLNKFNSLKQELSSCKSKLIDLKNTKGHNLSLQNKISRLNLDNESLRDEVSDLKRVIEKWTSSKVTLDQQLTSKIPSDIVRTLGERGKRKETIYSMEIVFTKGENSPSETTREVTSNTESECNNQEPLPPLSKLLGAEPIVKETKKKAQTKSPSIPDPSLEKKANSSTEQHLLTLMQEDYLKRYVWYLDSGCSRHMTWVKQYLHKYLKESGPKVLFGDNSSGDTKGYGTVNYNGITLIGEPYSTKTMKLCLLLQEEEVSMSLICHLTMKKAIHVSLTKLLTIKIKNFNEVRVKELKSVNRTEFKNHKLEEICDEKGIPHNFSSPYTPEQNGVAERRNITLIETARTILIIVKRHGKIACDVFIHNHRDHLGKLDEKADDGFFLGYSQVAKTFRGDEINFNEIRSFPDDELLVPRRNPSQGTRNYDYLPYVATFDPLSTNSIIIPNTVIPTTLNINSSNEPPEFSIADDHPVHNEPDDFEPAENRNDTSETQNIITPQDRWSRDKHILLVNILALKVEGWVIAMQEELNQFERNKVWTLVPTPYSKTIIGTKWIFKNKLDENCVVIRNKARLEAIGIYLAYATYIGFVVYQMDVKNAFFNRKLFEEEEYFKGLSNFRGKLVCWSAKKQSLVSMSSAEAEYVVAVGCCSQVLWIKSQLADYDILYAKMPIF